MLFIISTSVEQLLKSTLVVIREVLKTHILRFVRQLLSLYFRFYKVTMLENTNAIDEGKMFVFLNIKLRS